MRLFRRDRGYFDDQPIHEGAVVEGRIGTLDGPLLHCVLPIDAVFAIDTGWAAKWWVKPLLLGLPHTTVDPTKPLAARTLIHEVEAGQHPERGNREDRRACRRTPPDGPRAACSRPRS